MQIFARMKKKYLDIDQTLSYMPLGKRAEEAKVTSSGWLEEFCSCFKFCNAVFALTCRFKENNNKKNNITNQNMPVLSASASGPPVEVPSSPQG